MAQVVCIHSFRHGAGKSNLAANIATLWALKGRRVGIMDADFGSPSLPTLFSLGGETTPCTINDYLRGRCDVLDAVRDLTPLLRLRTEIKGALFMVPASGRAEDIAFMLREHYDVELLRDGMRRLVKDLRLETLVVDTHAGLSEETLGLFPLLDVLAVLLRHDRWDYQGTGVVVEVAHRLEVPHIVLIANEVPPRVDPTELAAQMRETYGCQVAGVIPHSDEWLALASADLFVLRYPGHPITGRLRQICRKLAEPQD